MNDGSSNGNTINEKVITNKFKLLFLGGIVAACLMTMLFSCENDIRKVNLVTESDSVSPVSTVKNIDLIRSESGKVVLELTAPLLIIYEGDDPHSVFPKGMKIIFFDSLMNITSQLTADYGISYEKRKIMEARNNVVVVNNKKHEQINTEQLIWNQVTKKLYSEKFVKITTPEKIILGDGFDSDETMDDYTIKRPRGTIVVNENENK
jgi:LPS export ABC transporter protein LptC